MGNLRTSSHDGRSALSSARSSGARASESTRARSAPGGAREKEGPSQEGSTSPALSMILAAAARTLSERAALRDVEQHVESLRVARAGGPEHLEGLAQDPE